MKTPLNSAIAQSDLDLGNFKVIRANLSDYAGSGLSWNSSSKKLDATGGADNTVTADGIGMVGDGVTDNTTALQTWINSVAAAQVNSTLLVPDGIYIFSGPLQDTGRGNAQIILPSVDITVPTYSITIKGYHPNSYIPWPNTSMPAPKGAVFRSTLSTGSGTLPAFIGGMGPNVGITPNLSFMAICLEDMIFQTVQNPQISCLNLGHFSVVEMRGDVIVSAGDKVGSSDTVQPTTSTSYGVILPFFSSGMLMKIENLNVSNFYTGVLVGELSHILNMVSEMCIYAVEFGFSYHSTMIQRLSDWWCKNGINVTDVHPFRIAQHDIERGPDAQWYTRVNDIDDAGNKAIADVTWWTVKANVGAQNVYTVNGATGVKTRRVGGAY